MRSYTPKTLKILFAKSGNLCAFPQCSTPLILNNDIVLAEIAHIIPASTKGPRANNSKQPDLNSHSNLILLCPTHHTVIDASPRDFTAEKLLQIKAAHEEKMKAHYYRVSEENLTLFKLHLYAGSYQQMLGQVAKQLWELLDSGVGMNFTATNLATIYDTYLAFVFQDYFSRLSGQQRKRAIASLGSFQKRRAKRCKIASLKYKGGTMESLEYGMCHVEYTKKEIGRIEGILKKRPR